ncbi:DNA polymerase III subunit beta [Candidatus Peregrinibacteria bacterium]|jgi:DNA polymerase III subunit beta|nr:DNA polymerase III subunit beta [Candidatus Peregrinibacteria bacterium]MBT4055538.1 DNA polymerase III subunit beta [Candidatus Peregrinibacteria bacterium]
MKLFCSRKDLETALNIVNKAISSNNTLPVLNNILVKAEGKKLHFSATNLEIAISFFIDADVRAEGAVTIPAKLITSYVSLLSDEKVELSVTDGLTLLVQSSTSTTKIKCISADEFPLIPKVDVEHSFKIPTEDLDNSIMETVFAASANVSRPVLSGVYLSVDGDEMKMVATDSYRLAEKKMKLGDKIDGSFNCIIPSKTVAEMGKITSHSEAKDVEVGLSKNQVLFKVGNVELVSRLIEGKFPEYERIIPKEGKTKVQVSVEELALVLKRVSLFARENNNSIKLTATNDGKLIVSSDETKVGEEKAEVAITIDGENNKISLNSQYMLDVLTYVNNDKIEIEMNDKLSPAVIRPTEREDYVYIIMPLKV